MKFEIAMEALICADAECTDEEAAASAEAIMEALVDMEVEDPFVGGSLEARRFEVTLVVEGESEYEAFAKGSELIQGAFSRAGVALKPRPGFGLAWLQKSVRPAAEV